MKIRLLLLILVACLFLIKLFIFDEADKSTDPSALSTKQHSARSSQQKIKKKKKKITATQYQDQEIQSAVEFCPELRYALDQEDRITEEVIFARNIHFERDGQRLRIRVFSEDGENGSFQKLVYFKEDSDGFAHIVKPKGLKEINPSPESISEHIQGDRILYESTDKHLYLKSGKSLSATTVNGKIKKVVHESITCDQL